MRRRGLELDRDLSWSKEMFESLAWTILVMVASLGVSL